MPRVRLRLAPARRREATADGRPRQQRVDLADARAELAAAMKWPGRSKDRLVAEAMARLEAAQAAALASRPPQERRGPRADSLVADRRRLQEEASGVGSEQERPLERVCGAGPAGARTRAGGGSRGCGRLHR